VVSIAAVVVVVLLAFSVACIFYFR